MSKYVGKEQHGYWWLHYSGQLRKQGSNCHGMEPNEFFKSFPVIEWWYIRCELDWYRMQKQYKELVEGPVEPITA